MKLTRIKMSCDADLIVWVIDHYDEINHYDVFDNCNNMTMFEMNNGDKVLIIT